MGRKRKMSNRDAILKASYQLFLAYGYDNVSIIDIEKKCNVQRRGIYRYFENKDEILGTIINEIEKKMLAYLRPSFTGEPLFAFVMFSIMKAEYAIMNPDYFRLRASFITRPETFIRGFTELYELSYQKDPDWKSSEHTMLQGLYVLGGMLLVQYGFINNLTDNSLSDESTDFITNYSVHKLSEQTINRYRRFMEFALRTDLHILGAPDEKINDILAEAYSKLGTIDISGFRGYYEEELGLV